MVPMLDWLLSHSLFTNGLAGLVRCQVDASEPQGRQPLPGGLDLANFRHNAHDWMVLVTTDVLVI